MQLALFWGTQLFDIKIVSSCELRKKGFLLQVRNMVGESPLSSKTNKHTNYKPQP